MDTRTHDTHATGSRDFLVMLVSEDGEHERESFVSADTEKQAGATALRRANAEPLGRSWKVASVTEML